MSSNQTENLRGMIEYARRWLPYGGGPDDEILVTFGIPGHQFHERLGRILDSGDPVVAQALTAPEAAAMRVQCRTRSAKRRTVPTWQ